MHCQRHTPYFHKANLCHQLLVPKIDFISNLAQSLIPVILSMCFFNVGGGLWFGFYFLIIIILSVDMRKQRRVKAWVLFFEKAHI